uniref:Uncharacterized protein n=1 Tax=Siphoviridae sp. ct2wG4 TaxID=2826278 RepID=A0A8S5QXE7_9CAUD|nr:MAG TPA: hypothetical protein [Siphoviridae sp. ct2wG4]
MTPLGFTSFYVVLPNKRLKLKSISVILIISIKSE